MTSDQFQMIAIMMLKYGGGMEIGLTPSSVASSEYLQRTDDGPQIGGI